MQHVSISTLLYALLNHIFKIPSWSVQCSGNVLNIRVSPCVKWDAMIFWGLFCRAPKKRHKGFLLNSKNKAPLWGIQLIFKKKKHYTGWVELNVKWSGDVSRAHQNLHQCSGYRDKFFKELQVVAHTARARLGPPCPIKYFTTRRYTRRRCTQIF